MASAILAISQNLSLGRCDHEPRPGQHEPGLHTCLTHQKRKLLTDLTNTKISTPPPPLLGKGCFTYQAILDPLPPPLGNDSYQISTKLGLY